MKSTTDAPSLLGRSALVTVVMATLFFVAAGFRPAESGLMGSTGASSVLLLSSYDDVYSLEYNSYWRSEVSEDFVEGRYDEVLDAASLGDGFFNQFLQQKVLLTYWSQNQPAYVVRFFTNGVNAV